MVDLLSYLAHSALPFQGFCHMAVNFYFWDWFSVLHGHLFSNFPFLPNEVFLFFSFPRPLGSVGLPYFPACFLPAV